MKKVLKLPVILSLSVMVVFYFAICASASGGFSVSAMLPENQKEGIGGYFNLTMQPGQTQELKILVENGADKEIAIEVDVVTASTNDAGLVNYGTQGPLDESLQVSLADLVTVPEERVTIPPLGTREIAMTVTMPQETIEGHLLGGINIIKEIDEADEEAGSMFVNQYGYVVALMINEGKTDNIDPELAISDVSAQLNNGRITFVGNIHNKKPLLMTRISGNAQVFQKGSDKPIIESDLSDVEIAPNSIYPLTLTDTFGNGVEGGEYLAKINMDYQGTVWTFEKEFTVESAAANEMNEAAVNLGENAYFAPASSYGSNEIPVWAIALIVGGGVLLVAAVAIIMIMLLRSQKANREYEKMMTSAIAQQRQATQDKSEA